MNERDKIVFTAEQLDELLNKIRADEREQIAKLVDDRMGLHNSISEAIRARGNNV